MVKSNGRRIQMPLSDDGRRISTCLQGFRNRPLSLVKSFARIAHEAILVTMFASQYAGARWPTDRIRTKRILEDGALTGQSVNVGSRSNVGQRATVCRNCLDRVIIGEDKQDIWPLWLPRVCSNATISSEPDGQETKRQYP